MTAELDMELDAVGILLEHPFFCGYCQEEMRQINPMSYKCVKCGLTYRGGE